MRSVRLVAHELALHVFLWALLGTPFSWHKARGGLTLDWVGYWVETI